MINTVYAIKKNITQVWDKEGNRLPITIVEVPQLVVTQVKTLENDGYSAIQLAGGKKSIKHLSKPLGSHLKKANVDYAPQFITEVQPSNLEEGESLPEVASTLSQIESINAGDLVKVSGITKGTGFTGVVKRWSFGGGPRTHGQSDRLRAPGSIGQGTTPGRVHKGKRMAGRDGGLQVTMSNLVIVKVDAKNNQVWIKGTTPGPKGTLLTITKVGSQKNFIGLPEDQEVKTETTNQEQTQP